MEMTPGAGKTAAGKLARYLYVTHLGANMSSAMINLMQPWLLGGSWLGSGNLLKGYKEAIGELGNYMKYRSTEAFKRLTDVEKAAVTKKFFKYADVDGEDLLGIVRTWEETLDNVSKTGSPLGRAVKKESLFLDYPMKAFEKAEWLNRSVMAHAVEAAYKGAGRNIAKGTEEYTRMLGDVRRMVQETQFGGDVMNTPLMFLGQGPFGRVFNNPLARQFLPFGVRSLTGALLMPSRIGAGERSLVGGTAVKHVSPFVDVARGFGISALIYEIGKNTLGADLSPGLFASSLTQLVGNERFVQDGQDWLPIPPVASIPINVLKGVAGGDYELLQRTVPRMLPGGIALSRAIGVLPDLPNYDLLAGLPGSLQKTYADWRNPTPDGHVAVYKGDGTLIGYYRGTELIARGLGVDMNKFRDTGDLDNYINRQREEMADYRRQAAAAFLSNDYSKGEAIRSEFQRRFGMPLVMTKDQLRQSLKARQLPRTERVLQMLPADARPLYRAMVASSTTQRTNLSQEQILGGVQSPQLTPDLLKRLEEEAQLRTSSTPAFNSFGGF